MSTYIFSLFILLSVRQSQSIQINKLNCQLVLSKHHLFKLHVNVYKVLKIIRLISETVPLIFMGLYWQMDDVIRSNFHVLKAAGTDSCFILPTALELAICYVTASKGKIRYEYQVNWVYEYSLGHLMMSESAFLSFMR